MSNFKSILNILDPADSYDLTALETIKSELRITDNSQDDDLILRIHRASEEINRYCRRVFAKETVREVFRNWNWTKTDTFITLQRTPINEITSISILDDGVTTIIDDALYEFDPNQDLIGEVWPLDANSNRELYPSLWGNWSTWCYGGSLIVDYVGGYELLDELPYQVEEACIELVKARLAGRGGIGSSSSSVSKIEIPGVWSKTVDVTSKESGMLFPQTVVELLRPFRKVLRYGGV